MLSLINQIKRKKEVEKEVEKELPITPDNHTPINTVTAVLDYLKQMEETHPALNAIANGLRPFNEDKICLEAEKRLLTMQSAFIDDVIAGVATKEQYPSYYQAVLRKFEKIKKGGSSQQKQRKVHLQLTAASSYAESPLLHYDYPHEMKDILQNKIFLLDQRMETLEEERVPLLISEGETRENWLIEKQQIFSDYQNYYRKESNLFLRACARGDIDAVKRELQQKSKKQLLKTMDSNGDYPLHLACRCGHLDVIKLLLEARANPTLPARSTMYAIHEAVTPHPGKNPVAILTLLKQYGAPLNSVGKIGRTVLHSAAYFGDIETCKWLLGEGVDINAQEIFSGETVLHGAISNGQVHIASFLLEKGANTTLLNNNRQNPLVSAMVQGRFEFIGVFMEHGVTLSDPEMKQLVEHAVKINSEDFLDQYQAAYQLAVTNYVNKLSNDAMMPDNNQGIPYNAYRK